MGYLRVVDPERCVGCQLCMFACERRSGTGGISRSAIHVHSRGGLSRGLTITVCRACEDPPCVSVCPTGALQKRKGGRGVIFISKKCIGCKFCLEACILKAIFWDERTQKPVVCIHCGYCVKYCFHNVLVWEEEKKEKENAF